MKIRYPLLLLPAVCLPLALIAQGPLTPPAGAPAPVMKTLQQVEPRTDVVTLSGDATSVFLVTAPGSYYLSANVAAGSGRAGIAISASNVTLDLNGFTITGAAGATRGVELRTGVAEVKVSHGGITGFPAGPGAGLATGATGVSHVQLEDLTIRSCAGGVLLDTVEGSTAKNVRVMSSTSSGLSLNAKSLAVHCTVENGTGSLAGTLFGIRGGTVDHCEINEFTNQGGNVNGISALSVTHCNVNAITGAGGGTSGITAPFIAHCRIAGVNITASSNLTGISSLDGRVVDCIVNDIGTTGALTVTGISGGSVSGCMVKNIGSATVINSVVGVSGDTVSDCVVSVLNAVGSVAGISAQLASHCRVSSLMGSSGMTGISADTATNCSVETLTQSGNPLNSVSGIDAVRVVDCKVSSITSSSSDAGVTAYTGFQLATGCTANATTASATGISTGFAPAPHGTLFDCTVDSASDRGIFGSAGCTIKNCTVRLNGAGTGILVSSAFSVVENNHVTSCGTGISVTGANGLIVRNRVASCTTNISTSATCQTGPTVSATGAIASTNPWANFTD